MGPLISASLVYLRLYPRHHLERLPLHLPFFRNYGTMNHPVRLHFHPREHPRLAIRAIDYENWSHDQKLKKYLLAFVVCTVSMTTCAVIFYLKYIKR